MIVRQEVDKLQARYLQLTSCSHLLGWEKDGLQVGHSLPVPFTFLEVRDKWAPGYLFMTGLLSTFQDLHFYTRNDNRSGVDNQTFSTKERSQTLLWDQEVIHFPCLGQGRCYMCEKVSPGSKRQGMPDHSKFCYFPSICLCNEIHLD